MAYDKMALLEYMSLNGSLKSQIPTELGNLTIPKHLCLGYFNVFNGGIPAELNMLSNLAQLDHLSCSLDREIPQELENLASL